MNYYWAIIIIVVESMATLFLAAKWAVQLKHSYEDGYKPKFILNEYEVYTIGFLFGGLGLLLSYIALKPIRTEDSLNGRRYLWISIAFTAIQAVALFLLFYFKVLTV